MALRRFIYVFILPFLAFTSIAIECGAASNSIKELSAAFEAQKRSANSHSGQAQLSRVITITDEGLLVSFDHHHKSSHSQVREKGSASAGIIRQSKWYYSSAFLLPCIAAIRDEIDSFIPLAQLIVFPKHWFW